MKNNVTINGVHINEHLSILQRMLGEEDFETAALCAAMLIRNLLDVQVVLTAMQSKAISALENATLGGIQ